MSQQQQEAVESPGGWLTKVASRICLELLGSARVRRASYVGEWIPEPLPERTEWIVNQWFGERNGECTDPGFQPEARGRALLGLWRNLHRETEMESASLGLMSDLLGEKRVL